jgi:hypothetical protein
MLARWHPPIAGVRRNENQQEMEGLDQLLPYFFPAHARQAPSVRQLEDHSNDVLFYHRSRVRPLDGLKELVRLGLALVTHETDDG